MINEEKKEQEQQDVNLDTFYIKDSRSNIFECSPDIKNIYSTLISTYIINAYDNKYSIRANLTENEKQLAKQNRNELRKKVNNLLSNTSYFSLTNNNDYIEFIKNLSPLDLDLLDVKNNKLDTNNIEEKYNNIIDNLTIDEDKLHLSYDNGNHMMWITDEKTTKNYKQILRQLALQIPNGDKVVQLFNEIDGNVTAFDQKIFGNDLFFIHNAEKIKLTNNNENLSVFRMKNGHGNKDVYIKINNKVFKIADPVQLNGIDDNKTIIEQKQLLKINDGDIDIGIGLKQQYCYKFNQKTKKYQFLTFETNNTYTYQDTTPTFQQNIVKCNNVYYGINNLLGLKITPRPNVDYLSDEEDLLYTPHDFEYYDEKGNKINIILSANLVSEGNMFSTNYKQCRVLVNDKIICQKDLCEKYVQDFKNKFKTKFIDDEQQLEFKEHNEYKELLQMQIHSVENNGDNISLQKDFLKKQVEERFIKEDEKQTSQNIEGLGEVRIEIDFSDLYTELIDINEAIKQQKNIMKEENTAWEDFLDFFINLFGLGKTNAEEKQEDYLNKINSFIQQVDNQNNNILAKKKKIVSDIITNFNNGFPLDKDNLEEIIDILNQDGLTTACQQLKEANNMCNMIYYGKTNSSNQDLLTINKYNAKNAGGPDID